MRLTFKFRRSLLFLGLFISSVLWPILGMAQLSGIQSIDAGGSHSCALTTAGGVKCWGWNLHGQLGDGSTSSRYTPVNVSGLATGVQAIALGEYHTCALTTAGGVKCWGRNNYGQLGDGSTNTGTTAVDATGLSTGLQAIALGSVHSCALTTAGGVKCWGNGGWGQLGDGSYTNRTTAVDVTGLATGVQAIALGSLHSCALTTAGGVKCWGYNFFGQLGDGSNFDRFLPENTSGLSSGIQALSLGQLHSCALTTSGGVKCWGYNYYGRLGDGSTSDRSTPVDTLGLLSGIQAISLGNNHSCALTSSGGVKCWGYNNRGQLGDGSTTTRTTAVDATGLANGLQAIALDGAHSCALTTAGGVKCWGDNLYGQLGDGSTTNRLTPTDVVLSTHSLSGAITVGGSPLSGVTVSAGALGNTTTDLSGAYSFTGVTYDTSYTITPTLTDYDFTPTSSSGTVTGDITHDFTTVYNPATTTSTSSIATTTTVPTTTTEPTTTVEPSSTTVEVTSTVGTTSTALATSSTVEPTTTIASTSVPTTSTVIVTSTVETTSTAQTTSTVETTTSVGGSTTIVTTTTPAPTTTVPEDSDGDGLIDSEEQALGTDPEDADSDDDGVSDSEEASTGTNPIDPGSQSPKLRTTLCSEWNGYLGGMYNIMEHVNLTTKKIRVKTELRSIRGHLKDTYEFFLRGHQQFDLLVHDMGGREPNSYGQVCTTYERAAAGSLDGRMVYYKYGENGSIQFAFALPFENPSRGRSALLFNARQPSLDSSDAGNLVANWVQLSNVSNKRLKGTLYFHSLAGTQLGTYSVNLRDGARYDYSGHAWGNQAGLARFVPTDNTVDYQLRGIRYLYDNSSSADSFTSAYPFSAAVGSGETLIAPVDTAAGSAILELANTLNKKVSVALNLYDQTGKKRLYSKTHNLKAYSSLHLPLDTLLAHSTGLLTAKSSHTGSLIGNVVHYGRTDNGGVKNMYAVPLKEPIGAAFKGSYNTYLNQGCTLYLGNSATAKEIVTISMKQNDGTSPVKDYSLIVPGRGVIAEDICAKSPKNVYGVVTVTAAKPKRISGLVVRNGEGERYKIATVIR
jgi:alpha-tubulin suppressor-like RCC1 family protein